MKRFMVLVAMSALMVVMMASSAAGKLITIEEQAVFRAGTPLPTVVCETTVASPLIGWRNGQCWVFHP